jgi:RNA polymerase sigma factor FliA
MMALADPQSSLTYARNQRSQGNALILSHTALVRKIAWHVHARVSSAVDIADLVQIGMVALVEAAQAYEDRGHSFSTYATMRVRGAMIDELRRIATIGRSAIARGREIAAARKALQDSLGRAATEAELAQAMGIDPATLRGMIDDSQSLQAESMDEVYSDHSMWFADRALGADEEIDRTRIADQLAAAIRQLPEREAMVLQLYFTEEMNLNEIGETLGIGAARVCQIKKAALDRLKAMVGERD